MLLNIALSANILGIILLLVGSVLGTKGAITVGESLFYGAVQTEERNRVHVGVIKFS